MDLTKRQVTKRVDEVLDLGNGVELIIIKTTPSVVKVGIRAPKGVRIQRGEVYAQSNPPAPERPAK